MSLINWMRPQIIAQTIFRLPKGVTRGKRKIDRQEEHHARTRRLPSSWTYSPPGSEDAISVRAFNKKEARGKIKTVIGKITGKRPSRLPVGHGEFIREVA